jgi:hypothetical protein
MKERWSYHTTAETIYGDNYQIPHGWKAVDFRPPTVSESFLALDGSVLRGFCKDSPRLILFVEQMERDD